MVNTYQDIDKLVTSVYKNNWQLGRESDKLMTNTSDKKVKEGLRSSIKVILCTLISLLYI